AVWGERQAHGRQPEGVHQRGVVREDPLADIEARIVDTPGNCRQGLVSFALQRYRQMESPLRDLRHRASYPVAPLRPQVVFDGGGNDDPAGEMRDPARPRPPSRSIAGEIRTTVTFRSRSSVSIESRESKRSFMRSPIGQPACQPAQENRKIQKL